MKQWMKKSLAACLALVMCLTLAACGGKEGETPAEESVNVRVAALKGPTAMGMVKLMSDSDTAAESGEETTGNTYEFTLAASADEVTPSMEQAITETERRRAIQEKYNQDHGITPQTIRKDVADIIEISSHKEDGKKKKKRYTAAERQELIQKYTKEMKAAAKLLEFEHAAYLRDKIKELEGSGPLPGKKRRLPKP